MQLSFCLLSGSQNVCDCKIQWTAFKCEKRTGTTKSIAYSREKSRIQTVLISCFFYKPRVEIEFYFQWCELLSYMLLINACGSEWLTTLWNDYLVFWSCFIGKLPLWCFVCLWGLFDWFQGVFRFFFYCLGGFFTTLT